MARYETNGEQFPTEPDPVFVYMIIMCKSFTNALFNSFHMGNPSLMTFSEVFQVFLHHFFFFCQFILGNTFSKFHFTHLLKRPV